MKLDRRRKRKTYWQVEIDDSNFTTKGFHHLINVRNYLKALTTKEEILVTMVYYYRHSDYYRHKYWYLYQNNKLVLIDKR
jgi:hypothetical protein